MNSTVSSGATRKISRTNRSTELFRPIRPFPTNLCRMGRGEILKLKAKGNKRNKTHIRKPEAILLIHHAGSGALGGYRLIKGFGGGGGKVLVDGEIFV